MSEMFWPSVVLAAFGFCSWLFSLWYMGEARAEVDRAIHFHDEAAELRREAWEAFWAHRLDMERKPGEVRTYTTGEAASPDSDVHGVVGCPDVIRAEEAALDRAVADTRHATPDNTPEGGATNER